MSFDSDEAGLGVQKWLPKNHLILAGTDDFSKEAFCMAFYKEAAGWGDGKGKANRLVDD